MNQNMETQINTKTPKKKKSPHSLGAIRECFFAPGSDQGVMRERFLENQGAYFSSGSTLPKIAPRGSDQESRSRERASMAKRQGG